MSVDLEAIEARANAATPGPWGSGPLITGDKGDYVVWYGRDAEGQRRYIGAAGGLWAPVCPPDAEIVFQAEIANAAFIAAAREDVPALVAEVRRLRQLLEP